MSIGIHHGSNGSFKTSGVIDDYFIPAALAGRGVVTNIKGCSRDRTILNLEDCSEDFEVIYINTDTLAGRAKIANWFHWVPQGYLLLFDEAGVIFPKAWNQKDIDKFNYPSISLEYCDIETREVITEQLNYIDSAETDWRPANWAEAWQKHRHWNWDIILTSPNIKYVRDDIRFTAEGGYKHKNKALLGPMFKGYKEGFHNAQTNGQSFSDFESVVDKRVSSDAFNLYDSTRTGIFSGTLNGFNMFANPRLLLAMGVAVLAFAYSFGSGGYSTLINGPEQIAKIEESSSDLADSSKASIPSVTDPVVESASLGGLQALSAAFDSAGSDVDDSKAVRRSNVDFGPLGGSYVRIEAGVKLSNRYVFLFNVDDGNSVRSLSLDDVIQLGYSVRPSSVCKAKFSYRGKHLDVYCHSYNSIAQL